MAGFVKLYRDIQEHWLYKDAEHFKVWFEMLANARYLKEPKTYMYEGVLYTLDYGEFIFGRIAWSKRLDVSEQKLRTFIQKLVNENMIVKVRALSKLSIYRIVNFEKFNHHSNQQNDLEISQIEASNNQQNNQQATSIQPANNQQITTNKESKESKKEKNYIKAGENNEQSTFNTRSNKPWEIRSERDKKFYVDELPDP